MNCISGKFATFISVSLFCFAPHSFAADQPTALVVAQDGAQLFYHQNGRPTDMEVVAKGTELKIEKMDGERCFTTYNGKPAYIRRQFLVTKAEFLAAQQKAPSTEAVPSTAGSTISQQQAAGNVVGYAWPKTTLWVTNAITSGLKPLKNFATYPLLAKLESGFSIVCEGADGQKHAALLPLKDRYDNAVNIYPVRDLVTARDAVTVSDQYAQFTDDSLMMIDLKPGIIPVYSGVRYSVLNKSNGLLLVECTFPELTQTVDIADI